jgi:hypothetical protein
MAEGDGAFEGVGVVGVIGTGGFRPRHAQQFREFGQEQLVVGQFIAGGLGPADDEGVDGVGRSLHGPAVRVRRCPYPTKIADPVAPP